ncbi:hypothetical protein F4819DRAFT_507954 [Hypoxylon fuscum]|nr:hypothetical protein F4819DRAFT_507954 [Hypoxylon fuscum]
MDSHQRDHSETPRSFDTESISREEKQGLLESAPMDRYNLASRMRRPCSYIALLSFSAVVNDILVTLFASRFRIGHEKPADCEQHRQPQQPVPFGGLPNVDFSPVWLHSEGKGFVVVKSDTWLPDLPGLSHPNMREEQQACISVFH